MPSQPTCPSKFLGYQCSRKADHSGDHWYAEGGRLPALWWTDAPKPPPERAARAEVQWTNEHGSFWRCANCGSTCREGERHQCTGLLPDGPFYRLLIRLDGLTEQLDDERFAVPSCARRLQQYASLAEQQIQTLRTDVSAALADSHAWKQARDEAYRLKDTAEAERDSALAELEETKRRMWSVEDGVIAPYNAELEARVTQAKAALERVGEAVETRAEQIERDCREPDKVLCGLQALRSDLLRTTEAP